MDYLSGTIWADEPFEGYVAIENNIIIDIGEGKPPTKPILEGNILPGLTDSHTHVGDSGLKISEKMTLEQLVAPPNGLKHVYLRNTPYEKLVSDMKNYTNDLIKNGVSRFIDFRENGIEGARMLKSVSKNAVILGRPISSEFDINEIEKLLEISDGIGIPSISDMPSNYIDKIADVVHSKNKYLAIHVSERIREDIDKVISLRPDLIIHMCEATYSDLLKCADENIPISVCARSNLYFDKVPQLGLMYKANNTVSIGTDNAMLSTPDIFSEAAIFDEIASSQDCPSDFTTNALIFNGNNLLNATKCTGLKIGSAADITVTGKNILSGQVFRLC